MKHVFIGLGLAFALGGCLGSNMAEEPPPEFIEVPRTKIVEAPTPAPVEVSVVPESCLEALALADIISRRADKMYQVGTTQLAIVSAAREALADGVLELNAIEVRQRNLQGRTVGHLYAVSEATQRFTILQTECKEASK